MQKGVQKKEKKVSHVEILIAKIMLTGAIFKFIFPT